MSPPTLYQQVLGERFADLPLAVQRFHRLSGQHTLEGWVETRPPTSALARLLALCLGAPQQASSGVIRFELWASPEQETWTRHFPLKTMRSRLRRTGPLIEERLGACVLGFRLQATDQGLVMELKGLRFFGLPCPRCLQPAIVAREQGDGDALHFEVSASLPWMGTVANYRGHLIVGTEDPP
jgi:hypothetical protein